MFTRRVETVKLADQTSCLLLAKLGRTGSPSGSLVGDRLDARPLDGRGSVDNMLFTSSFAAAVVMAYGNGFLLQARFDRGGREYRLLS